MQIFGDETLRHKVPKFAAFDRLQQIIASLAGDDTTTLTVLHETKAQAPFRDIEITGKLASGGGIELSLGDGDRCLHCILRLPSLTRDSGRLFKMLSNSLQTGFDAASADTSAASSKTAETIAEEELDQRSVFRNTAHLTTLLEWMRQSYPSRMLTERSFERRLQVRFGIGSMYSRTVLRGLQKRGLLNLSTGVEATHYILCRPEEQMELIALHEFPLRQPNRKSEGIKQLRNERREIERTERAASKHQMRDAAQRQRELLAELKKIGQISARDEPINKKVERIKIEIALRLYALRELRRVLAKLENSQSNEQLERSML